MRNNSENAQENVKYFINCGKEQFNENIVEYALERLILTFLKQIMILKGRPSANLIALESI